MSVFAEPLAQARKGYGYLDYGSLGREEFDAALDLIEQRAKEMEQSIKTIIKEDGIVVTRQAKRITAMEKALRRIADIPPGADDDSIYARGIALAALSAREEAQT